MEGEYLPTLTQALERRRDQIGQRELPKLKELFRVFHTSFKGIYELLIRKGIIHEDPYRNEQKISEVKTPSSDPFTDSDRDSVMAVRLGEFDGMLEFLNNYYEFSIDFLTFARLKDLTNLVRYVAWEQLSQTSPSPTTRGLAELLAKARQGGDNLSTGLINDSTQQLARHSHQILELIKAITAYHRERFKRDVREQVMPSVADRSALRPEDPDSIKTVKRAFAATKLADPFIPELITEIIQEDADEALKNQVLERLSVTEKKRSLAPGKETMREALIEATKSLGRASRPLDTSVERLVENAETLASRRRSFIERFKAWIDKLSNRQAAERVYPVKYVDEDTGSTQTDQIRFTSFIERVGKKARLYGALLAKSGAAWKKIQGASDEQLSSFVTREIEECQIMHRRLQALDAYFKEEATAEERRRMKGIKIELTSLKNGIVKANQFLHEFNARKEEYEQMKKLGVTGE